MKHDVKNGVQPERDEKQKGHNPPIQSQKTADPNLANLTRKEIQHMSRDEIMSLQQTFGNRAVSRLMTQRAEEDEMDIPGPRSRRAEEDEMDIPGPRSRRAEEDEMDIGPRMKPQRENGSQPRGGADLRSSSAQRAAPHSSATGNLGDAVDLDGQALYGWDRTISATDVATVVNGVIPTVSGEEEMPRIVIFSGTHGNTKGHLVNNAGSRNFVAEDQATASAVMAANPGVQVEVIDVVTSYPQKSNLTSVYGMTNYIRILGWCYSKRSHGLGDSIKSNWWPSPDNL